MFLNFFDFFDLQSTADIWQTNFEIPFISIATYEKTYQRTGTWFLGLLSIHCIYINLHF